MSIDIASGRTRSFSMALPSHRLDESSFQLWLLSNPQAMSSSSVQQHRVDNNGNYYGLLSVSQVADDDDIDTAFRRLSLSYHPDNIPSTDSDEVRQEKTIRFRAICEARNILLHPALRNAYDELRDSNGETCAIQTFQPCTTLADAYIVWASAVLSAFKRSASSGCSGVLVRHLAALGVPAIMIAIGGAERGGRLCMSIAVALASDTIDAELQAMSEEDMGIFRQAVMVLAKNTAV